MNLNNLNSQSLLFSPTTEHSQLKKEIESEKSQHFQTSPRGKSFQSELLNQSSPSSSGAQNNKQPQIKATKETVRRTLEKPMQELTKREQSSDKNVTEQINRTPTRTQYPAKRLTNNNLSTEKNVENEDYSQQIHNNFQRETNLSKKIPSTDETEKNESEVQRKTNSDSMINLLSGLIQGSQIINFLEGRIDNIPAENIPAILTENKFIADALSSEDVANFLNTPMPAEQLLKSLELIPEDATMKSNELVTPNQLFKKLGIDQDRIVQELTLLPSNLQLDGFTSYIARAAALQTQTPPQSEKQQTQSLLIQGPQEQSTKPKIQKTNQHMKIEENSTHSHLIYPEIPRIANTLETGLMSNELLKNTETILPKNTIDFQTHPLNKKDLNPIDLFELGEDKTSAPTILSIFNEILKEMEDPNMSITLTSIDDYKDDGKAFLPHEINIPTKINTTTPNLADKIALLNNTLLTNVDKLIESNRIETIDSNTPKYTRNIDELIKVGDELNFSENNITQGKNNPQLPIKNESNYIISNKQGQLLSLMGESSNNNFSTDDHDKQQESGSNKFEGVLNSLDIAKNIENVSKNKLDATNTIQNKVLQAEKNELMQKIIDNTNTSLIKGGGTVKLDFTTKDFGKIDISISVKNSQLDLKIEALSDQARDIIVGELPKLKDSLLTQNINLNRVDVTVSGGGGFAESFQDRGGNQQNIFQEYNEQVNRDGENNASSYFHRSNSRVNITQPKIKHNGSIQVLA